MRIRVSTFKLGIYLTCSLVFLLLVGIPALRGDINLEYYADSETYEELARQQDLGLNLISVGANYLGPILLLKLLNFNYPLIYLFNVSVFLLTYAITVRHFPVDRPRLLTLLFLSVMLFSSLISVNKEIMLLLVAALLAAYTVRRRLAYVALLLPLSLLVRWQMTVIVLAFVLITSRLNPWRERRALSLAALLLLLSLMYPGTLGTLTTIVQKAEQGVLEDPSPGTGLFPRFNQIQNNYGYFLVVIPKTFFLMVGVIGRFRRFADWSDFYNNVIVFLQSVANLYILVRLWRTGRTRLSNNLLYLACVFCAIISLTPIFSTRYLLPTYLWFAIIITSRETDLENAGDPGREMYAEGSPVGTPAPTV